MVNKIKVRYIPKENYKSCLNAGVVYEAFESHKHFFGIKCDFGEDYFFPKRFFEIVQDDNKEQEREIENKMKLKDILKVVNTSQTIRIAYSHTGEVFYPRYSDLKMLEEYEVVDIEGKDGFLEITINPTEV